MQSMVANHSTPLWDLYLIYEGQNQDTGLPIIKAFLNPLVLWIWIGTGIVLLGTLVALTPNLRVRPVANSASDAAALLRLAAGSSSR
jgi:cytochrome c-type biogenesis protein CcmF